VTELDAPLEPPFVTVPFKEETLSQLPPLVVDVAIVQFNPEYGAPLFTIVTA
jgi:hypothetical protein